ncbi:MAG: YCF48-related protein, partial [Bacteroidota bacterium]
EGWAAGSGGTILHTTTGGLLWDPVTTQYGGNLNSVFFYGNQKGWIVGDISEILYTVNGGLSWQSVPNPTVNNLKAVQFVNSNVGWAAGNFGTILKTIDGGLSWAQQSVLTQSNFFGLDFADSQRGWAVGANSSIYRTTDGGGTWEAQTSPVSATFYAVKFLDTQLGWVVGSNGVVLKTSDGGTTWVEQPSPTANALRSVYVVDRTTAYAVGFFGTLIRSTDGSSWLEEPSGVYDNLWSVRFVDKDYGWIAGESGVILNARTAIAPEGLVATKVVFTVQPTNVTVGTAFSVPPKVSIQDADGNTVATSAASVSIAIGNNPSGGTLSGTTTVAAVNGVATFPGLSIDKVGNGYTLVATSGGLTTAISNSFNVILGSTGIVLAYDSGTPTGGVYEQLPNAGWILANRLTASSRDVKLLKISYYYSGDHSNKDGSFIPVVYASSVATSGVPAASAFYTGPSYAPSPGWNEIDVSSANLSLAQTTSTEFFVGMKYNGTTEPEIGYIPNSNGRGWEYDPTKAQWFQLDAEAPPFPATLFIRATVASLTGVQVIDNTIPKAYSVTQNFPNPFNPSTTIQYGLPQEVHVRLTVHNTIGQEIATLVDAQQAAGTYSVRWNGKDDRGRTVASGAYFYRLQAGGFVSTKKVLLLK